MQRIVWTCVVLYVTFYAEEGEASVGLVRLPPLHCVTEEPPRISEKIHW